MFLIKNILSTIDSIETDITHKEDMMEKQVKVNHYIDAKVDWRIQYTIYLR